MRPILLALKQLLRKSCLILSLMVFLLSGLFVLVQPASYAVEGINQMVKPEEKTRQERVNSFADKSNPMKETSTETKKRPIDVEAEEVKKGIVEEGKVVRDLLTGKKPDGTSVFDSNNK